MNYRELIAELLSEAWDALHVSLPARWHIGKPSYDAAVATWCVTAWGPSAGLGEAPPSVTGTGETELGALRDLDDRLRRRQLNGGQVDELRLRLRMAYVDGAEAFSRETRDRGLTTDELGRIIEDYEG